MNLLVGVVIGQFRFAAVGYIGKAIKNVGQRFRNDVFRLYGNIYVSRAGNICTPDD